MSKIFLLGLAVMLSSCSSFRTGLDWPEGVPDQDFFRSAWQSDIPNQQFQTEDDYLFWITRFYNGVNLVPGWLDMTEQLLAKLEEPQRSNVSLQLFDLGGRIGSEWAKDNRVRLLNTRSAAVWRDALLESLEQDDLQNYLDQLNRDVSAILSGELVNDDIYFERYYVDDFDF